MIPLYLPDDEWINLDHIRVFQLEREPFIVMVTWTDGSHTTYRGDRAAYLLAAWIEVVEKKKMQLA